MVQNCNELERIRIFESSIDEKPYDFLQSAAKALLLRTSDIPVTILLPKCKVKISQFKSEDATKKIFFEVDKDGTDVCFTDTFKTFYSSYDVQLVLEKIRMLIRGSRSSESCTDE